MGVQSGKDLRRGECVSLGEEGRPELVHDCRDAEAGLGAVPKPVCNSSTDDGRVRPIQAGIALCVLALLCVTRACLDMPIGA